MLNFILGFLVGGIMGVFVTALLTANDGTGYDDIDQEGGDV